MKVVKFGDVELCIGKSVSKSYVRVFGKKLPNVLKGSIDMNPEDGLPLLTLKIFDDRDFKNKEVKP